MKKLMIPIFSFCFLCFIIIYQNMSDIPYLELSDSRIQIAQMSDINYLSYVKASQKDMSKISYTRIDTSQIGTYHIDYQLEQIKKTLIVDVVEMYENSIFNPEGIQPEIIDNPDDITVLVNKTHQLPQNYQPKDLVSVTNSKQKLRKEAAIAYQKMYQEARKRNIDIYAVSGYRTYQIQQTYWKRQGLYKGKRYASMYSAYPGRSEHQTGLAIDVSHIRTGERLVEEIGKSELGQFIVNEGYKYGFILRYPRDKVKITNYAYEPWHIRYVGVELAKKLHQSKITLEEYYETNPL